LFTLSQQETVIIIIICKIKSLSTHFKCHGLLPFLPAGSGNQGRDPLMPSAICTSHFL